MPSNFLDKVVTGKSTTPHRIVIYGPDGVGLTTFAAGFPAPLFLSSEDGIENLDVSRYGNIHSFHDLIGILTEFLNGKHKYKTLVFDSLDWFESIVAKTVCEENDWDYLDSPGYGKGYSANLSYWEKILDLLRKISEKYNIVLIAHAQVKVVNDPRLNEAYDQYQLKLNDKITAKIREFSKTVLFADFKIYTKKQQGMQKSQAVGFGERVMFTERRPAFHAKNKLNLPFELPLSYQAFSLAVEAGRVDLTGEELAKQLTSLASGIVDKETKKKALEAIQKAGNDKPQLLTIKKRIEEVVNGGDKNEE